MLEPFPWTESDLVRLREAFAGDKDFIIIWPWATYHKLGASAMAWAAKNSLSVEEFEDIIDDLSCPSASKKMAKKFRDFLKDDENRILRLDPAVWIKKTFTMAKKKLNFEAMNFLTVNDLLSQKDIVGKQWIPEFPADEALVESWLAHSDSLLNCFQSADPWSRLRLVESLVGVANPSSILNFHRIV